MDLNEIEALALLINEHPISEILIEQEAGRVHLRKGQLQGASTSSVTAPPAQSSAPASPHTLVPGAHDTDKIVDSSVVVTSKLVGIFHHMTPGIRVGSVVKSGQSIGHVETMKLMNEVAVESNGQIVEVSVEDGETVMYGQPLFRLLPA